MSQTDKIHTTSQALQNIMGELSDAFPASIAVLDLMRVADADTSSSFRGFLSICQAKSMINDRIRAQGWRIETDDPTPAANWRLTKIN